MLRACRIAAVLAVTVLLVLSPLPARADKSDAWRERIAEVDVMLRAQDWARADREATEVLKAIVARVAGGPGEPGFVGLPMTQIALARAGLGDRIGAEWWWWSAQQVLPDAALIDLAAYGDVGAAVRDLGAPPKAADLPEIGRAPERPFHFHSSDPTGASCMLQRAGTAPERGQMLVEIPTKPLVPGKAQEEAAAVSVRVVIDPTGRMTRPVIVPPQPSPAHVAGALLSLETWRSVLLGDEPAPATAHVAFASMVRSPPTVAVSSLTPGAVTHRADAVIALLKAGDGKQALKEAGALVQAMIDSGYGAKDQEAPLARALVLRARAAELAGDARLASWSARAALLLSPEASGSALLELGVPSPGLADAAQDSASVPPPPVAEAQKISPEAMKAGLVPPMLLQRAEPNYPLSAKRARAQGEVVLEAVIDEEGHVLLNRILSSPDPILTMCSLEAARQWRYKPATMNGSPQAVFLILRMKFNLQ